MLSAVLLSHHIFCGFCVPRRQLEPQKTSTEDAVEQRVLRISLPVKQRLGHLAASRKRPSDGRCGLSKARPANGRLVLVAAVGGAGSPDGVEGSGVAQLGAGAGGAPAPELPSGPAPAWGRCFLFLRRALLGSLLRRCRAFLGGFLGGFLHALLRSVLGGFLCILLGGLLARNSLQSYSPLRPSWPF